MHRKVRLVRKGIPTLEGAGVHLHRLFGNRDAELFDPFLLMDDFSGDRPDLYEAGFPWHPHRGIETITYMLRGSAEHRDSLGNEGVIGPGDIQWMTAGSGIIHQEMPKGDSHDRMGGFQLWANLPARQKMMDPRYRDVRGDSIPEITVGGIVKVRLVAGEIDGHRGPVRDIVTDPELMDVSMPKRSTFVHSIPRGHTVFAYVFEGEVRFTGEGPYSKGQVVLFENGDSISAEASDDGARFILASGRPLKEPIAWAGPIVMNSDLELKEAFSELRKGTFVKVGRTID